MLERKKTKAIREYALTIKVLIGLLTAAITFVALYQQKKELLEEFTNQFNQWLYQDANWNGLFNDYPEGLVDLESFNLTNTSLQLVLESKHGKIQGVIAETRLCKIGFPHDYKLVDGNVGLLGDNASITVFDFRNGNRVNYAEFSLKANGTVLEVTPKANSEWFGKETIRIAKTPDQTVGQAIEGLSGFCKVEQDELYKIIKKIRATPRQ